jgi:hypothetical protein
MTTAYKPSNTRTSTASSGFTLMMELSLTLLKNLEEGLKGLLQIKWTDGLDLRSSNQMPVSAYNNPN